MSESEESEVLAYLRKQVSTLQWKEFEQLYAEVQKEDPDDEILKDRDQFFANLVYDSIKRSVIGHSLLDAACKHGLADTAFCTAVFGKWPGEAKEVEIDKRASDDLCDRLAQELEKHKETVHAVGAGGLMPKSFIAAAAVEMLDTFCLEYQPPPLGLVRLFRLLLDTDGYGSKDRRKPFQQSLAAILFARDSSLSNQKLAEAVGVSSSTVSGWRNDPSFKKVVRILRDDPEQLRLHEELLDEDLSRCRAAIGKKGFGDQP